MPFKPDELLAIGLGAAFVAVLSYCLFTGEKPNRPIDSIRDGLSRLWHDVLAPTIILFVVVTVTYVSCTSGGDNSPDCRIALDCEEPDR